MSGTDVKNAAQLKPLSLHELCEVLVRHYGLTDGKFDLLVNFQMGVGTFGPDPEQAGPGMAISLHQIGLAPLPVDGVPNHVTVDAATVAKTSRRKRLPAA